MDSVNIGPQQGDIRAKILFASIKALFPRATDAASTGTANKTATANLLADSCYTSPALPRFEDVQNSDLESAGRLSSFV
jgi:hypothetical protein